MSSIKRGIRYFHVVVVQWWKINAQKKRYSRAKSLFYLLIRDGRIVCSHKAFMALNHLWGISVTPTCCVVLWKWLQVLQWGERLKKQASEASRAGVWGEELGPFPLLSPPLGSLCLPFFCFVFVFFFCFTPTFAFSPHYGTWSKASYRWFLCCRSSPYGMFVSGIKMSSCIKKTNNMKVFFLKIWWGV